MDAQLQLELLIMILVLITARAFFVIHKITTGHSKTLPKRTKPCKTLICIGSGGHTTEMLKLMEGLNVNHYSPRVYVMASSDKTSLVKVEKSEKADFSIKTIPRSRHVGQSYFHSIFTTILSTVYAMPLILFESPDLILCNGPGTCVPICLISFLFKCAFICDTKIVFVESFCRTESFSLTGKILMYVADNFVVQWPSLKRKLKRAEYIGQLM